MAINTCFVDIFRNKIWNPHSDMVLVKMIHNNTCCICGMCNTYDIIVRYHKANESGGKRQANIPRIDNVSNALESSEQCRRQFVSYLSLLM